MKKNEKSIKDLKNLHKLINVNDKTLNIKNIKHTIWYDNDTQTDGDTWKDRIWKDNMGNWYMGRCMD